MAWNEHTQADGGQQPPYPPVAGGMGAAAAPEGYGRNPLQPMPGASPNQQPQFNMAAAPVEALQNPLTANVPPNGIMPNMAPNMAPQPGIGPNPNIMPNAAPNMNMAPNQPPQAGERYLSQELYQSPGAQQMNAQPAPQFAMPPMPPAGGQPAPAPAGQSSLLPVDKDEDGTATGDALWIGRAKRAILQTKGDPYRQLQLIQQLRVMYHKERFNRTVKTKDK